MNKKPLWWYLATWFGSGLAPIASGTFGSLAALPFAFIIQYYLGNTALAISAVAIFFVGWWAANEYMKHYPEKHDPKEIVIDEVAGMWLLLSLFPLSAFISSHDSDINMLIIAYIICFFLFRIFDIVKPWPVSWADKKIKGGFGVMFDDILAAIYPVIFGWMYAYYALESTLREFN
ncbi:MAG: phosphatidylglycerophosphatase A [Rickettsiales bacterium]